MIQAVDTNILVYAHRAETSQHASAFELLRSLACGQTPWVIAWPSFYEFVRVVTHPRIFRPNSTLKETRGFLEPVVNAPSLRLVGPGPNHWEHLLKAVFQYESVGNLAFDAQLAAIYEEHGVTEVLSADADFRRYSWFKIINPFGFSSIK